MGRVRTDYDDYVSVGSSDKSALMHANLKTVVMTRTDRGTLMTETYMLTSEGFVTRTTYEFGHTQAQGAGNGMFVEVGQPLTVFIGQDGLVKLRAEFDELAESQASTDSVRV